MSNGIYTSLLNVKVSLATKPDLKWFFCSVGILILFSSGWHFSGGYSNSDEALVLLTELGVVYLTNDAYTKTKDVDAAVYSCSLTLSYSHKPADAVLLWEKNIVSWLISIADMIKPTGFCD